MSESSASAAARGPAASPIDDRAQIPIRRSMPTANAGGYGGSEDGIGKLSTRRTFVCVQIGACPRRSPAATSGFGFALVYPGVLALLKVHEGWRRSRPLAWGRVVVGLHALSHAADIAVVAVDTQNSVADADVYAHAHTIFFCGVLF